VGCSVLHCGPFTAVTPAVRSSLLERFGADPWTPSFFNMIGSFLFCAVGYKNTEISVGPLGRPACLGLRCMRHACAMQAPRQQPFPRTRRRLLMHRRSVSALPSSQLSQRCSRISFAIVSGHPIVDRIKTNNYFWKRLDTR
jgi:hypothetical protein